MLNNISRDALAAALADRYPAFNAAWAERTADRLLSTIDDRLEINVREWLEGRPLTDIWVRTSHGRLFSVASLMEIQQNSDFVSALTNLNILLSGNEPLAMTRIFPVIE
ncbi:MAG: hypothetical protein IJE08_01325 [Clostridia bacterium]|nr:hypothetical protein [Clostridia bacterium]